jgi:GntR family transcriptional regulator, transcriptional repressor for pyruvate dehydrogenase complex
LNIEIEPVERSTVSEEIVKQLISLINTGKLTPGSKLPSERELMEKFHVSRSSVREALHALTMIGLLETFPGAGTFVSQELVGIIGGQLEWAVLLGNRELMELMEIREPLEIQAAGLAAERSTPEMIQQFRQTIDRYSTCEVDNRDPIEGEIAVHMAIASMSGNPTLIRLLQTFQDLLTEYRRKRRIGFSTTDSSIQEYRSILNAIEAGDADSARQYMARHLAQSKRHALVDQINEQSDQTETGNNI